MKRKHAACYSPPKAEVAGSNPAGCTNQNNDLDSVSTEANGLRSCADAQQRVVSLVRSSNVHGGSAAVQYADFNRQRWAWLKAVTADGSLSPMARLLASVLVTSADRDSGKCCPGNTKLADALCTSVDTIKRAFRALSDAGWLTKTEGRGAGNTSQIVFHFHTNVVPLSTPETGPRPERAERKGGNAAPFKAEKKGANLREKGGKSAPSYNKDKPNKNQSAGATPTGSSQRPRPDLAAVAHHGTDAVDDWDAWLVKRGLPTLRRLNRLSSDKDGRGFDVPWRRPPPADDATMNRIALKFFEWAADQPRVIYDR